MSTFLFFVFHRRCTKTLSLRFQGKGGVDIYLRGLSLSLSSRKFKNHDINTTVFFIGLKQVQCASKNLNAKSLRWSNFLQGHMGVQREFAFC